MNAADEIKEAMTAKQIAITRFEVKALLRRGDFATLGIWFDFQPKLVTVGGVTTFDWKSAPDRFLVFMGLKALPNGDLTNRPMMERQPGTPRRRCSRWRDKPVKPKRERLFAAQRGICFFCKQPTLLADWTVDHLTPRCRGGTNQPSNLVGACKTCNGRKMNLTLEEFNAVQDQRERKRLAAKISATL